MSGQKLNGLFSSVQAFSGTWFASYWALFSLASSVETLLDERKYARYLLTPTDGVSLK